MPVTIFTIARTRFTAMPMPAAIKPFWTERIKSDPPDLVAGRRAGGVWPALSGAVKARLGAATGSRERLAVPTGENEPTPNQRLPPREMRTELRRTTRRAPELHRQGNALEIERSNPTLEPLPTNADQEMPTPSGPATL